MKPAASDEIGFLAQSFNDMTRALLLASEEAETGRARLQAQGEYLETVLGNLSSGVLTLDSDDRLVRVNRAAERILDLPPGTLGDRNLEELQSIAPHLQPLVEVLTPPATARSSHWQQEVPLEHDGRPLVLLARGSALPGQQQRGGRTRGRVRRHYRAQPGAARRGLGRGRTAPGPRSEEPSDTDPAGRRTPAHEAVMDKLEARDAEMLDRSATTIVAQVEALRKLVDAFGDYARDAEMERAPVQLDALIGQVTDLYRQGDPRLRISTDLCPGPDGLLADSGQLRQLLHNLLRNAIEAAESDSAPHIRIRSREVRQDGERYLQLDVSDDGPGFPRQVLDQPFEPYVSSKPGGSGLGLAICRKVVTDHDGSDRNIQPPRRRRPRHGGIAARAGRPAQ